MKVFKKIYTIFAASACAFLLLNGCSAITNGLSSAEAADFSVSGEISCSGASPRAATSALKDDITWKISAKKSDGSESVEPVTAKNKAFTLNLPSAGKWKIFASGFSGETQILSGEKEVTVDVKGLTGINISVAVSLDFSKLADFDAVTGNVELPVTDNSGKIAKVSGNLTYVLYDVDPVEEDSGEEISEEYYEKLEELMKPKSFSATFSNGTASIKLSDLTPGLYDAKIQFLDSAGNALYSCMEQFTVYSGFTTDTWYGTAPYLSDGKFELTSALLGTFASYIVPSTKYALYNFDTNDTIDTSDDTYNFYLKDSANASISGDADFSTSNNSFTFDNDGYFYIISRQFGSAVCITSNKPGFGSETADSYDGAMYLYGDLGSILTADRKTSFLYMFNNGNLSRAEINRITQDDGSYIYDSEQMHCYKSAKTYIISEEDENRDAVNSAIAFVVYDNIGYFANTGTLAVVDFSASIFSDDDDCYHVNVSKTISLNLSGSDELTVTDMLYQDGCVYILLKESNFAFGSGENNFAMTSRGAVVRYNTLTGQVDTLGWTDSSNGTEFRYGNKAKANEKFWPSCDNSKIYYQDRIYDGDGGSSLEIEYHLVPEMYASQFNSTGNGTVPVYTPLLTSLDRQFTGPQKFVALKPKKLVIADSGIAFYTDADGVWKYKNINRLVTVDLDSFILTDSEDLNSSLSFTKKTTKFLRLQASAFEASILLDTNNGNREFSTTNAGSYYGINGTPYGYASIICDEE